VVSGGRLRNVEEAYKALLGEIRRRLAAARDDPNVTNADGSNYWGPYVTRAINARENDGPALVQYIRVRLGLRGVGAQSSGGCRAEVRVAA
jgi:hypothetical protein